MYKSVIKNASAHSSPQSTEEAPTGDPRYLIQYPDTEEGVSYQGQPYLRILTRFLKEMELIAPFPGDVLNSRGWRLKDALQDTDPSHFKDILTRTVAWNKTKSGERYAEAHRIFRYLIYIADILNKNNKDEWAIGHLKDLVKRL